MRKFSNRKEVGTFSHFHTEDWKKEFVISYHQKLLECFHPGWQTKEFLSAFMPNELDEAVKFGLEQIMFRECASLIHETDEKMDFQDLEDLEVLDPALYQSQLDFEIWWFKPETKSNGYIGALDYEDSKITDKIYKIFITQEAEGQNPPYLHPLKESHPCCQTDYMLGVEGRMGENGYAVPLHKIDEEDKKLLMQFAINVSLGRIIVNHLCHFKMAVTTLC